MDSKRKKFLYWILGLILALTIIFCILYSYYWSILISTVFSIEGLWIGVLAIILRILILGVMSFFLFRKWLKQEAIYL
ncbi:MAG: hypothetical protein ACFE96_03325, partial [Candidatus Hermodarchaeota archaeon]